MSEARWDVLGFGVVAVDDLIYLDGYPAPDTKMQVMEEARQGGGLTGTALVAVTRLGGTAAYAGVLDDEGLSQYAISSLEREGIDCSVVTRREGARPTHSTVIVDRGTGQRCILFSRAGVTPPAAADLPESLIAACRVLFVDSTTVEANLHAMAVAKRHGIPSVADVEHHAAPRVDELIAAVDHLIVGVELAGRVTGAQEPVEMVRALAKPDRAATVVTGGDRGCWYAEGDGPVYHFPAFKVQVVDTTGCGDVFHGVYAVCIAHGESVSQAIRVAAASAALKATKPGGRTGIPTRPAVDEFLAAAGDVRATRVVEEVPAPERPIGQSYWVRPGQLLAGEYPGAADELQTRLRIRLFLNAGITFFLDMTEEGEAGLRPLCADSAGGGGRPGAHRHPPAHVGARHDGGQRGADAHDPGHRRRGPGRGRARLSALLGRHRAHGHGGGLLPGAPRDDRRPGAAADQGLAP